MEYKIYNLENCGIHNYLKFSFHFREKLHKNDPYKDNQLNNPVDIMIMIQKIFYMQYLERLNIFIPQKIARKS